MDSRGWNSVSVSVDPGGHTVMTSRPDVLLQGVIVFVDHEAGWLRIDDG